MKVIIVFGILCFLGGGVLAGENPECESLSCEACINTNSCSFISVGRTLNICILDSKITEFFVRKTFQNLGSCPPVAPKDTKGFQPRISESENATVLIPPEKSRSDQRQTSNAPHIVTTKLPPTYLSSEPPRIKIEHSTVETTTQLSAPPSQIHTTPITPKPSTGIELSFTTAGSTRSPTCPNNLPTREPHEHRFLRSYCRFTILAWRKTRRDNDDELAKWLKEIPTQYDPKYCDILIHRRRNCYPAQF